MMILRKLLFVSTFCFLGAYTDPAYSSYNPLEESEYPKRVVSLHHATKTTISMPGIIDTEAVELGHSTLDVEVQFRPGHLIPCIRVPEGFPTDINNIMPIFISKRGNVYSFDQQQRKMLLGVTGYMRQDAELPNGRVIGQREFYLEGTVEEFLSRLERTLKNVQTLGFIQTCLKNPDLTDIARRLLNGCDSDQTSKVGFNQLRALARLLSDTMGGIMEDREDAFFVTIYLGELNVHAEQGEAELTAEMRRFFLGLPWPVTDFLELSAKMQRQFIDAPEEANIAVRERFRRFQEREQAGVAAPVLEVVAPTVTKVAAVISETTLSSQSERKELQVIADQALDDKVLSLESAPAIVAAVAPEQTPSELTINRSNRQEEQIIHRQPQPQAQPESNSLSLQPAAHHPLDGTYQAVVEEDAPVATSNTIPTSETQKPTSAKKKQEGSCVLV